MGRAWGLACGVWLFYGGMAMVTDLRYAIGQLAAMRESLAFQRSKGTVSLAEIDDRVQRALDALERCLEQAVALEALADADNEPVAVVQSFGQ